MERAISSSAREANCSEVPLGVHQAQRWGVVEVCSLWGVCLSPHPVSQGRILNLAITTGLDFSLGLFFWPRFSGLQGECGQREGVRAAPEAGSCPFVVEQDCGVIGASVLVLIPEPTLLSSFLGAGGVIGAGRHGMGSRWPSPGEHSGYQLCALPISGIENSSQKLPTAALLMTGVVVLGNSLGCLWVSSPFSKKRMVLTVEVINYCSSDVKVLPCILTLGMENLLCFFYARLWEGHRL